MKQSTFIIISKQQQINKRFGHDNTQEYQVKNLKLSTSLLLQVVAHSMAVQNNSWTFSCSCVCTQYMIRDQHFSGKNEWIYMYICLYNWQITISYVHKKLSSIIYGSRWYWLMMMTMRWRYHDMIIGQVKYHHAV